MRKISFYPKLAGGNLWRNRTTYIPYLVASTTAVATFYCLLAIYNSEGILTLRGAMYVQSIMLIAIILLTILVFALLLWTNSFLIKRRKKELGLYSVLGMEKRNISLLLFVETLMVAVIALVVGLAAGMLFSRLVFLLLLKVIRYNVLFTIGISGKALLQTAAFFGVVFLLILLHNLRQVGKVKPVELMAGAREGEKEPRASWLITLLGLLFIGGGYAFALLVTDPVWALLIFLFAAISVILGTYCLFTSGSILVLKAMRRKKSYYYTPKHFVSVSGMLYRMKQNAAGLATICILSCMVLVTVSCTLTLYNGGTESYDFPRGYKTITYNYTGQEDAPDTRLLAEAEAQSGAVVENALRYREYLLFTYEIAPGELATVNGVSGLYVNEELGASAGITLLTLADYNAMAGTSLTLQPGQALLHYSGMEYTPGLAALTVNGIRYEVAGYLDSWLSKPNGFESYNSAYVMVLPDEAALHAAVAAHEAYSSGDEGLAYYMGNIRTITHFDLTGTAEQVEAFYAAIFAANNEMAAQEPTPATIQLTSEYDYNEQWYAMNGGFMFLGMFFGALFLAAAAMIIYYKQVSEGYQDRERFDILQKVGMSAREVKKTINSQVSTVFFLPLGVALLHIIVAYNCISRALVIFEIGSGWMQLVATAVTFALYVLVYFIVYKQTAKTYFKIVRHNAA